MNLQKNFERRLQIANQRNVVVHTDEEEDSFSHRLRHNLPKSNVRTDGSSRAGPQLANSTELPGHDHVTTVMLNVSHRVSEILPQPHDKK